MDLPKTIRVAAFNIAIERWQSHDGHDRNSFGEFSALQQSIRVDQSLKPQKLLDTMLHELSHAIYWAYHLDDDDKEERIVSTFATAWAQVWRDNPEFHQWVGQMAHAANQESQPSIHEIMENYARK